jgi:hypothetical protein
MTVYTPNFADPRIRRRCIQTLEFTEQYLMHKKVNWISRKELYQYFGNTSRDLGKYLKDLLLTVEDNYFNMNTGQCKKYSLNKQGFERLKHSLGITEVPAVLTNKVTQELESGVFEYSTQSDRQFHPLQFKPKYKKQRILRKFGYKYEFDIKTAAHTLILQYARTMGYSEPTPALELYIQNKDQIRQDLAQSAGIDSAQTKRILTGILQGASLSPWHTNLIFAEVNYRRDVLEQLRSNTFIKEYQEEVRSIWKYIKRHRGVTERMTGRVKSAIYRELESSVRTCVQKYLNKHKNTHFFEHDGWTCREMPDVNQLTSTVKRTTGFMIELDCTIYEHDESSDVL